MKIAEFSDRRSAAKFTTIGDFVEGPIVEQPELIADKFGNPGDKVLVLAVDDRMLFARRQMLDCIADALREADVDEIEDGGWLRVEYTGDKPTGANSNPMKCYSARYIPPQQLGQGVLGVDDPGF